MRSATENRIRELTRQLEAEKTAHAITRNALQAQVTQVWRLVPSHYINLMGVYPALRRLLHVLGEAADLQDPTRGAPTDDTRPTTGMSPTELAVITHRQHRADVNTLNRELEWWIDRISKIIPGVETQYNPPAGQCLECGQPLYQNGTGRPRAYCSDKCRIRNSTKRKPTTTVDETTRIT